MPFNHWKKHRQSKLNASCVFHPLEHKVVFRGVVTKRRDWMKSLLRLPFIKKRTLPRLESPAFESVIASLASKASVNERLAVTLKDKQSAEGWAIRLLPNLTGRAHEASKLRHFLRSCNIHARARQWQSAQIAVSYRTYFNGGSSPCGPNFFLANIKTIPWTPALSLSVASVNTLLTHSHSRKRRGDHAPS